MKIKTYTLKEIVSSRDTEAIECSLNLYQEVFASTEDITDDAERIKAMLLHTKRCSMLALLFKQKIARDWDYIEETLHYESFWTFINPNPEHERYATHRITFLFEMLLRCEQTENGGFVDIDKRLSEDPHYILTRILPLLLDMRSTEFPFLKSNISIDEWRETEMPLGLGFNEFSPGMTTFWAAVKILHERMWQWFVFSQLRHPAECLVTPKGADGANAMRDILFETTEAHAEDLIPTGRTLADDL